MQHSLPGDAGKLLLCSLVNSQISFMRIAIPFLNALLVIAAYFSWFSRKKETFKYHWIFLLYTLLSCLFFATTYLNENATWGSVYIAIGNICVLLFMPCAWLCMRVVASSGRVGRDSLPHLLPAVFYSINYGWGNPGTNGLWHEAVSPATYIYIVAAAYLFLQLNTALTLLKTVCPPALQRNFIYFRWLVLGCLAQYALRNPWIGSGAMEDARGGWLLAPVAGASIVVVLATILKLLERRVPSKAAVTNENTGQQTYGHEIVAPEQPAEALVPPSPSQQGIVLLEHQLINIEQKVNAVMLEKKQFLMPRYTIRMLSDEVGISLHILSAYINRKYGMNFNDFINEYRIKYCLEKIKNNEWKQKTLEAISRESGFNNRNSFTLSFKKVIGVTPSDFLKQLNSDMA
jgi:AraC-like DNA-binding protein